jgi:hypothetical protein
MFFKLIKKALEWSSIIVALSKQFENCKYELNTTLMDETFDKMNYDTRM